MDCNHENFDEYFEVCTDCKASKVQVIADEFKNELQKVYAHMLDTLDITSGDIAPNQLHKMNVAEDALAIATSEWLISGIEQE